MPPRNGLAAVPPARVLPVERKPFRVTPATITYTIEADDGETVALAGYMKAGCPLDIAIAYDEALADNQDDQPTEDDRASMKPQRYYARLMRAERMLRRALLQAVIPGLSDDQANVLAGDDGPYEQILTELGWWTRIEPDEADADPEAVGGAATTGPAASPASSPATESIPSGEAQAPA